MRLNAKRFPTVWLVAAMALAGCNEATYTVLTELPDPPDTIGAIAPAVPLAPAPSAPAEPLAAAAGIPSGWDPAVHEHAWRHIVVHHSATPAGNAAEFDRMHRLQRGWDELGYHFVITNGRGGPDGSVEVGSRWAKQKWGAHTGGTANNEYNEYGIGVCLVGDFDQHAPTEAQLASLSKLIDFLTERYDIPLLNVIGHREAPLAATACPGQMLSAYLSALRGDAPSDAVSHTAAPAPTERVDRRPDFSGS